MLQLNQFCHPLHIELVENKRERERERGEKERERERGERERERERGERGSGGKVMNDAGI